MFSEHATLVALFLLQAHYANRMEFTNKIPYELNKM